MSCNTLQWKWMTCNVLQGNNGWFVSYYSSLELRQGSSEELPSSNVSVLWFSLRFRLITGCPCWFNLPDQTLSSSMRGSRWPSYADHYCLDCESSRWLLYVAYCTSWKPENFYFTKLSLPFLHPSCLQRPWKLFSSTWWLLHALYLYKLVPKFSL